MKRDHSLRKGLLPSVLASFIVSGLLTPLTQNVWGASSGELNLTCFFSRVQYVVVAFAVLAAIVFGIALAAEYASIWFDTKFTRDSRVRLTECFYTKILPEMHAGIKCYDTAGIEDGEAFEGFTDGQKLLLYEAYYHFYEAWEPFYTNRYIETDGKRDRRRIKDLYGRIGEQPIRDFVSQCDKYLKYLAPYIAIDEFKVVRDWFDRWEYCTREWIVKNQKKDKRRN